ncbi:MAG TPA: hypothetical protein VEI97_16225 [bacterium]|nr:hypothetical protein [bacterium]
MSTVVHELPRKYRVKLKGPDKALLDLTLATGLVFMLPWGPEGGSAWATSVDRTDEATARAILQLAHEAGLKGYATTL